MSPNLCEIQEFTSSLNPSHKIQYTCLNPGAPHALLLCHGAGVSAKNATLYQSFFHSHPDLCLLCIDRWTQPSDIRTSQITTSVVARQGPTLLTELTSITIELLDSLNIQTFSVAAHSAGAYQMLSLAEACYAKNRVRYIFPVCTHIPATFLSSPVMNLMTKVPGFLFNGVTYADRVLGDTAIARFFIKQDTTYSPAFVDSENLQKCLETYRPTNEQVILEKERNQLDYKLAYARIPGIPVETLTDMYMRMKDWSEVKVAWFTCDGEVFFGPESVRKVVRAVGRDVEIVVVPEAVHNDILRRTQVWEGMYERIVADGSA